MKIENNEKLAKFLAERNDKSYQEKDIHQSIMNIFFDKWNEDECKKLSYHKMVEWMEIEHGKLAAFAVLIGKYNQQVENGGHVQYYDNGYSSGDWSLDLHEKMKNLFVNLDFHKTKQGAPVYEIISDLQLSGVYYEDPEDCEDYIYDEDSTFEERTISDADNLDKRYYEVNQEWIKFFNSVLISSLC